MSGYPIHFSTPTVPLTGRYYSGAANIVAPNTMGQTSGTAGYPQGGLPIVSNFPGAVPLGMPTTPKTPEPNVSLDFIPPKPIHLPDPAEQREMGEHVVPVDKVLRYNIFDEALSGLKTVFYTMPKTVIKGLRGDKDFGFSDFMLISKIPYYAGGLFLTYSFMAGGGSKIPAMRQGLGAGLYYLGVITANHLVDQLYKARFGVDFSARYRRADGRIEKMFASHDFPRMDLLTPADFEKMRKRMGIPKDVADNDAAVQEQLRAMISNSRATKLLLANVFAAAGAGWLARTDTWAHLSGHGKTLWNVWTDPTAGHLFQRVGKTLTSFKSHWGPALKEKLTSTSGSAPLARNIALGAMGASVALALLNVLRLPVKAKYESGSTRTPLTATLPALVPLPESRGQIQAPLFRQLSMRQTHPGQNSGGMGQ